MKYKITPRSFFIYVCVIGMSTIAQLGYGQTEASSVQQNKNDVIVDWLQDLHEPGISKAGEGIIINEESTRLLYDFNYRQLMYPDKYTWGIAMEFIKKQELNKAFWYFVNLYRDSDKNKDLVINSLLSYDRMFKMDEILVSMFYTYCYMDPEVAVIVDGKAEIISPHIMEEKLDVLNDILFYLDKFKEYPDSSVSN